jgi:hypothetical protein
MKERGPSLSRDSASYRRLLLRAAVEEPLPNGALVRAGKRFGLSAVALQASSVGLAKASVSSTAVKTAATVTFGNPHGAAILVTLGKAIVVGFGSGLILVGTAQWATERARAISPNTTTVAARARTVAPPSKGNTAPEVPRERTLAIDVETPLEAQKAERKFSSGTTAKPTSNVLRTSQRSLLEPRLKPESATVAVARFVDAAPSPAVASPAQSPAETLALATSPNPSALPDWTLAQEVRILDHARSELDHGDARVALAELERESRRGRFLRLSHEASVLRVEALGVLGRRAEAASLARQLLTSNVSPSQRTLLERWLKPVAP